MEHRICSRKFSLILKALLDRHIKMAAARAATQSPQDEKEVPEKAITEKQSRNARREQVETEEIK
jgi:hypothetical protein